MQDTYRRNPQGLNLRYRSWPLAQPRAVLGLIHGQGEHIGRYDHLAAYMNQHGIAVYGFDHQGHGKSDGKRGHAPSLDSYLMDVEQHVQYLRNEWSNTPLFVYAHSMGGNLALNTALRGMLDGLEIHGMIATAPWIRLAFEPSFMKVIAGKLLKTVIPGLSLPTGLAAQFISRDSTVVEKYKQDPLVHGMVSASAGIALMEGAAWLDKYAGKVPFPLLIMHGTSDKLTSQPASEQFSSRLAGDITYQAWPGLYHEIHNEPEQMEVFDFSLDWLEQHL
jgi:alpha-beta hydrolase superfamily lysophospholipase